MSEERSLSMPMIQPEFINDLKVLTSEAHTKLLDAYVAMLMDSLSEGNVEVSASAQSAFAVKHNLKVPRVNRAFRGLAALAQWMSGQNEVIVKRLQDMIAKSHGDVINSGRFEKLVKKLFPLKEEIKQGEAIWRAIVGVLPMYSDIGGTIDARAIWKNETQVKPLLVPIASIKIDLDAGEPGSFNFQITEAKLDSLVEELQRVQESIKKLKRVLSQEGGG